MKNERFISADAFIEDLKTEAMNLYLDGKKGTPRPREDLYAIIDRINEQPVVDAVEVIRCKDCRFYEMGVEYYPDGTKDVCRLLKRQMLEDGFCSIGERKEEKR